VPGVVGKPEIEHLIISLQRISGERAVRSRGGVYAIRSLLHLSPVIRERASSVKIRSIAEDILEDSAFPARATLFDKTADANWLVPWHRDLTICVGAGTEVPGYGPWSKKAGVWHVQPPTSVLERMLSVRIHLDCSARNDALRVIPGTNRSVGLRQFGSLSGSECLIRHLHCRPWRSDLDAIAASSRFFCRFRSGPSQSNPYRLCIPSIAWWITLGNSVKLTHPLDARFVDL
jgi:hypothetical protein